MAIVDLVKYDGNPSVFAWKYPSDSLSTWTQLIVHETQEAILFKGGQALDTFGPGRHTLETANIPILSKLISLPFGGRSPFTAEVWFINKVFSLDIKWGTATPIQLQDPKYNVFIPIRSFGQFGIQVVDSRKFLFKLVGTLPHFTKDHITTYFKGLYMTKVKDSISGYLIKKGISMLEINAYLDEVSMSLKERVEPIFEEFGIKLASFNVTSINVPEDDPAVKQLKAALAKRAEMDIVGYSYTQERSFDTLEGAAKNTSAGSSGVMGAGMGMAMGVNMGQMMGQMMGGTMNTAPAQTPVKEEMKTCIGCQALMPKEQRFCHNCGVDSHTKAEQQKPVEAAKHESITCDKCSHVYSSQFKFCPECGDVYNPCRYCGTDLDLDAKSCHKCGKKVPLPCPKCTAVILDENVKFCPECGESLQKKCGRCQSAIEGSPKFCPECGERL